MSIREMRTWDRFASRNPHDKGSQVLLAHWISMNAADPRPSVYTIIPHILTQSRTSKVVRSTKAADSRGLSKEERQKKQMRALMKLTRDQFAGHA